LLLRTFRPQDVTPPYVDALNDPEVVHLTEARHRQWDWDGVIEYVGQSNIPGESHLIGIFLQESERHIGNIRIFNFSQRHRRLELGIMIFDKTQWGKGYGTESLSAVTDYAFQTLKMHRVCADYYVANTGSARIFAKAGFVIEGLYKAHCVLDGEYVDSVRIAKINTNPASL
jgi:RimJ/RimL family protein N-acetyltransferase